MDTECGSSFAFVVMECTECGSRGSLAFVVVLVLLCFVVGRASGQQTGVDQGGSSAVAGVSHRERTQAGKGARGTPMHVLPLEPACAPT